MRTGPLELDTLFQARIGRSCWWGSEGRTTGLPERGMVSGPVGGLKDTRCKHDGSAVWDELDVQIQVLLCYSDSGDFHYDAAQ